MDSTANAGWELDRPRRSLIPLTFTVPLCRFDDLADGDLLVFPSADRIFRICEIDDDGAYGGDVCEGGNLNCLLSWEWYSMDDLIDMGMRIFSIKRTLH